MVRLTSDHLGHFPRQLQETENMTVRLNSDQSGYSPGRIPGQLQQTVKNMVRLTSDQPSS